MALNCDILIIGGGPGGYVAAIRAAQLGARTVLAEKAQIGGVCLNRGCIPTKAMLACSEKVAFLKEAQKFGINNIRFKLDFEAMHKRKEQIVRQLRDGVGTLLKKNNVHVVNGTAQFLAPHEVTVKHQDHTETIRAKHVIIATGAMPVTKKFPHAGSIVGYSDDALSWPEIPGHLVVVGGGYIGLEFAMLFNDLGSRVAVVEALPAILANSDEDIQKLLLNLLREKGITIHLESRLVAISGDAHAEAIIDGKEGRRKMRADKVLLALGREPDHRDLCLDKIGLKPAGKAIPVDANFETEIPRHYAIGDVNGKFQLAHAASAQGLYAVEKILVGASHHDLRFIPGCLYTVPEIASVGLTEKEARQIRPDCTASKFPLAYSGKSLAIGSSNGFVKIISEPKHGEILGIHIIGPRASDIIGEAVLALRNELTLAEIATTVHAHPTLAESLMEAAHLSLKTPVHAI